MSRDLEQTKIPLLGIFLSDFSLPFVLFFRRHFYLLADAANI